MCLRKILLLEILHRLFEMLGLRQAWVVVAFGSGARCPSFLAGDIRDGRFGGPEKQLFHSALGGRCQRDYSTFRQHSRPRFCRRSRGRCWSTLRPHSGRTPRQDCAMPVLHGPAPPGNHEGWRLPGSSASSNPSCTPSGRLVLAVFAFACPQIPKLQIKRVQRYFESNPGHGACQWHCN